MRAILAASVALALAGCAGANRPIDTGSTAGSGVRIETTVAGGGGIGSGVYIGNGVIITNAHVVDGALTIKIKSDVGDVQDAEVLWVNAAYDIAAVRPDNPRRFAAARLSCREPAVDELITANGNPAGVEFITMRGYVSGKVREMAPKWKAAFITDMTTIGGMSGGPVYAADGDVIGITAGVMAYGGPSGGMGFAVPASAVCGLLGRA